MRTLTIGSLALASALTGCTAYYPVQGPAYARLSPAQVAAIESNDRLSPEERQRLAAQDRQVLADQETYRAPQTVIVEPSYGSYYPGYYPYYAPYAPFYPGLSLSLGYVWRGGGGWHGGGRGWRRR